MKLSEMRKKIWQRGLVGVLILTIGATYCLLMGDHAIRCWNGGALEHALIVVSAVGGLAAGVILSLFFFNSALEWHRKLEAAIDERDAYIYGYRGENTRVNEIPSHH